MAPRSKTMAAVAAVVAFLLVVPPASAHHVMGGELPSTAWQGLLSGLGHPIIGIDHFAFIVGVGLMSYLVGRIALPAFLFVAGTVLGCFVHVQGMNMPLAETAVAVTVAAAALMVGMQVAIPIGLLAILFFASGVFHGYAYGESIVGAETAPLVAYVLGFGAIQYCIAAGSGAALRTIVGRDYLTEAAAMRLAGGGIALAAAFALVGVALAG